MAEEKKELQKINPLKQFEMQIAQAKGVKDILKVDVVKDRYIANFKAITGREDALQVYEAESFAFIDLANRKPEIMDCDPFSLVAGFIRAATYGLSFSGNDLSVYPRGVKQKDGSYKNVLVCDPEAHGKRRLLERMPTIKQVEEGVLVFKNDKLTYDAKKFKVLSHEQSWPRPEASEETVIAAYCTIKFADGSEKEVLLDKSELKKARNASKQKDGGQLWITYYGEACKKTTYNRAFKFYYKKPETAVLFQQWEAPPDDTMDVPHQEQLTADPTVVDQQMPSAEEQKGDDFNPSVNEETGEVYQEPAITTPKKDKPARKSFI